MPLPIGHGLCFLIRIKIISECFSFRLCAAHLKRTHPLPLLRPGLAAQSVPDFPATVRCASVLRRLKFPIGFRYGFRGPSAVAFIS
jgi:hypothetical protein